MEAKLNAEQLDTIRTVDGRYWLPTEDMFAYKYVLDIEGNGYSSRTPTLLLGNSVVVLQGRYTYWWSATFADAVVACAEDMSDLVPVVQSLQQDDARAHQLVRTMQERVAAGALGWEAMSRAWHRVIEWLAKGDSASDVRPPGRMKPFKEWVREGACSRKRSAPRRNSDCTAYFQF